MKRLFTFVLAGIIGGLIVVFSNHFLNQKAPENTIQENYSKQVNENTSPVVTGPDFSMAAEKALDVVVQINAQESEKLVQEKNQQYSNPLQDHPFFREFDLRGFGFGYGHQQKKGSGSGVIISPDGYVVTNNHVVEFADEIEVILRDGKKYNAKKVGTDPRTDLAVLKIEGTSFPTLQNANSDQIKVGEWVLAVGNPYGYLTSTVTAGIVSAKGRDLDIIGSQQDDEFYNPYERRNTSSQKGIEEFIQTDAAVNPGNSGGALVDANGRLVGINSAIASKTGSYSGYSFAIPVNLMNKVVHELMSTGTFERGQLGIQVLNVDEESQKVLKLNDTKGVVIESMLDNSSAKKAGLLPNDVIIAINNKEVKHFQDLQHIVGLTKVGETLNVRIIRDGVTKEVPVRIVKGI